MPGSDEEYGREPTTPGASAPFCCCLFCCCSRCCCVPSEIELNRTEDIDSIHKKNSVRCRSPHHTTTAAAPPTRSWEAAGRANRERGSVEHARRIANAPKTLEIPKLSSSALWTMAIWTYGPPSPGHTYSIMAYPSIM